MWTVVPLVLATAGIIGLFVIADWYKGERDLVDLRKKCLEAEEAGVADACAVFELDQQLTIRTAESLAAEIAKAREDDEAEGELTPDQRDLLDRAETCKEAFEARSPKPALTENAKDLVIALCASLTEE